MRKIPTMFDTGQDGRVISQVASGCEWVARGEGVARQKVDGTAMMIDQNGGAWKRRMVEKGKAPPDKFLLCTTVGESGKQLGWVPVTTDDLCHQEGLSNLFAHTAGTYELIGPKIQSNPEGSKTHYMVRHDLAFEFSDVPRDFEALREWLRGRDIEGLVFSHPDGRRAKIKLRDFGMERCQYRNVTLDDLTRVLARMDHTDTETCKAIMILAVGYLDEHEIALATATIARAQFSDDLQALKTRVAQIEDELQELRSGTP